MVSFKIASQDKKARTGLLKTPHGVVETPAFLPVGTQAAVKALDPRDLRDMGDLRPQIILASTYHLYLRPGVDVIAQMGGIHKFMEWDGPVLTDSGGFQIFSLGFGIEHEVGKMVNLFGEKLAGGRPAPQTKLCQVEEEGRTFQSHLDGSTHFFPPEKSVECQIKIGADLIIALDECTSPLHDYEYTKISMERSHRWEKRSLDCARDCNMFGIIQGGPFKDLRIKSAKFVSENNFFGVAVGGALVNQKKMIEVLDWVYPYLDPQKPRHLLGIGTVPEIFLGVERGMDMFDAVVPTRLGRMGNFT